MISQKCIVTYLDIILYYSRITQHHASYCCVCARARTFMQPTSYSVSVQKGQKCFVCFFFPSNIKKKKICSLLTAKGRLLS